MSATEVTEEYKIEKPEIIPTRQQKRKAQSETKKLNVTFINMAREFKNQVLLIEEDEGVTLEGGQYGVLYLIHLKKYEDKVDEYVKAGKFKYTSPDRDYFKRNFNPTDGVLIN